MEKLNFYVNNKIVYVDVIRTTNKNMYLKVKDSQIIVSAHKRVKLKTINAFVSENIEKFVDYAEKSKSNILHSINESFIYVGGKKNKFKVLTGFKKNQVIKKNSLYIETKTGKDDEIEQAIKDWTKEYLLAFLEVNQPKWEKIMEVPKHSFRVAHKTSTWGSNKVTTKSISYSSKLSHYQDKIIDYVIIHELAHHIEPNHSSDFWDIVKKYKPDYKKIRKQLRSDSSMDFDI